MTHGDQLFDAVESCPCTDETQRNQIRTKRKFQGANDKQPTRCRLAQIVMSMSLSVANFSALQTAAGSCRSRSGPWYAHLVETGAKEPPVSTIYSHRMQMKSIHLLDWRYAHDTGSWGQAELRRYRLCSGHVPLSLLGLHA